MEGFMDWLGQQRSGALAEELTEQLAVLNQAVVQHNKAGTLTLTVRIEPQDGEMGTVFVTDDVKIKEPRAARPARIWYVNGDDYGLQRHDPRQTRLDFETELAKGNLVAEDDPAIPPVGTAEGEVPLDPAD